MAYRDTIPTVVIVAVVVACWLLLTVVPAVQAPFYRDDYGFCFASWWVDNPIQLVSMVQPDDTWRPLTAVSWWLGWRLFGRHQWMYAIPNWILLLATGWLWVKLWRRWGFDYSWSVLSGCMLLCHPIACATASWRDAIGDVATGFFWLAAFLAYLKYGRKPNPRLMLLSLACVAGALLYKENAVVFPLFLVAWEIWGWERARSREPTWLRPAPFFVLVGVFLGLRYLFVGHPFAGSQGYGVSLWADRLAEDPWFPVKIWGNLFWAKAGIRRGIAGIIVAIGLLILARQGIRDRHGGRPFVFFLVWLILALLPVLPALPKYNFQAPEFGRMVLIAMMAVVGGITWAVGRTFQRTGQLVIGGVFLLVFTIAGIGQSKVWTGRVQYDGSVVRNIERVIRDRGGGVGEKEVWIVERGVSHELADYILKYYYPEDFGGTVIIMEPGIGLVAIPEDLWGLLAPGIVLDKGYGHQRVKVGPYYHTLLIEVHEDKFVPEVPVYYLPGRAGSP